MFAPSATGADLISQGFLMIGDGYRAKNEELGSAGLPFARAGNIKEGFLHSYDALCENRASVHVGKSSQDDYRDAKVWLEPEIEVAHPGRILSRRELNRALQVVEENHEFLLEEWYAYKSRAS